MFYIPLLLLINLLPIKTPAVTPTAAFDVPIATPTPLIVDIEPKTPAIEAPAPCITTPAALVVKEIDWKAKIQVTMVSHIICPVPKESSISINIIRLTIKPYIALKIGPQRIIFNIFVIKVFQVFSKPGIKAIRKTNLAPATIIVNSIFIIIDSMTLGTANTEAIMPITDEK